MKRNLSYLCLQATREGQASYAHVHEIIWGLRKHGWMVSLYQPSYAADNQPVSLARKLLEFFHIQISLLLASKPDVLYVRNHPATVLTMLWARMRRIPIVLEINGPYEDVLIAYPWLRPLRSILRMVARFSMHCADSLVVVTPHLKDWVKKEVEHESVYVIPNAANTELFRPDASCSYALEKPYVVFFGVLARWQGINTLLEAVESTKWPEEVNLVVLGDGVERSRVELIASRNHRVVYLGKIPYRDVPGIVAQSIAGLIPKNATAHMSTGLFPLKLFETLACGVPAVVTNFPGQADLVHQYQCGIVIPPNDPKALADAVSYLFKNSYERNEMGCRGREMVVQKHSWHKMAARTHDVLSRHLDHN